MRALAQGPAGGPLVVLLHGFPELARSWRHQLPALAGAGYRAVAPDLRGYGGSDVAGPYDVETLTADLAALVRALGRPSATIVGHDWGGVIAWTAAARRPELVERLVILNCPHPARYARELLRSPGQLPRSLYVLLFLVPGLPERLLAWRRAWLVGATLRRLARRPAGWPPEEVEAYRRAFADVDRTRAALGYYRAAARRPLRTTRPAALPPIGAPTLILWGLRDPALVAAHVAPDRLAPLFAAGRMPTVHRLPAAGHLVQNDEPETVNRLLLLWLAGTA